MKRAVLLLLSLPVLCRAQVAELSLKGGVVTNDISASAPGGTVSNPPGYSGSLALTFGLPANFRLGASVSIYKVSFTTMTYDQGPGNTIVLMEDTYQYGAPCMPVEVLLMKRFNISRLRIDIGGSAGIFTNKKLKITHGDVVDPYYIKTKDGWCVLGVIGGVQYRLGCRWAIGAEAQPKWMTPGAKGSDIMLVPVMAKLSVSL